MQRTLFQEYKYYLSLVIPMSLSLSTEQIMHFFDRLFLSNYSPNNGEVYINAVFTGALMQYTIIEFFVNLIGYSSVIVAQHFGAERHKDCGKIIMQAIRLSLYIYPVIIIVTFFIDDFFKIFHHTPLQEELEIVYTRILLYGGVFPLLRAGIGGFFIGIGKTKIVLLSSLSAMILNIPLNYILIFNKTFPAISGVQGAALGTIISSSIACMILFMFFYHEKYHSKYHTKIGLMLDKNMIKKFFRYGTPAGLEGIVGILGFTLFIFGMNSYGKEVGAAASIAISWDGLSYITLLGACYATSALVGQYMGAKNIQAVYRVTWISCINMLLFICVVAYFFLFQSDLLISIFLSTMENAEEVHSVATTMLRIACVYIGLDGLYLMISSILKGAGDTKGVMYVLVFTNFILVIATIIFIFPHRLSPIGSWKMIAYMPLIMLVLISIRFFQKKWKHISLVE